MDSTKIETEFKCEKVKESIEAIMLIGLIGHFTGYRPDNDEETENAMVALGSVLNDVVEEILEGMNEDEIHEMVEHPDDGMDVFKKELFDLMKRMETM